MNTNRLLFTFGCLCSIIVYSNACSCMPQHMQERFCESDFVILARVKREHIIGDRRVYKVRVKKEFKTSEKAIIALKSGKLMTAAQDSLCGVNLDIGKTYVLSGRIYALRAQVNLCGIHTEWQHLTKRQKKGLRLLYRHGCNCKIRRCFYGRCHRQIDSCTWRNSCESNEGICLRQNNQSCMWAKTRLLSTCTKEWRRNSTITAARNHRFNLNFSH
ncbi:tissue inhibitor of metalloproteinase [Diorhabda carinulata]|uniref:tissue inhibitor of metalloproteinase n=1 Tax=Diorhabda sublineata TaxID=1163346 RepID=UPI0024E0B88E|nr:tissue inhibitor of metalloproteinase [Diorhabda sublineata]XP_056635262.1 tissue inhibitor of metalloproteinase [Diorhabda sublineata]XP_056635263.1 tissue inhibitor of metalloproteinase [Diorhabda sublineata]XP_057652100.1 tissue inhibitor of metalloproteinase [Diorhabda carinulata]XP_057652102.1 tissue inhibitor of metalloproteinase [Diorhabda carinulata]XP_057652103.1 tissue inhibitor of metalloproteinase [Diorhabda carinulata]